MVHEDYKEMIPARALSALDAAEVRVFDDHLSQCNECRLELQEWEATAAAMAMSANPMEPSPEVRVRILNEVRKELSTTQVVPFPSTTRNIWTSFGSLGAIAAVVLVTALIVGLLVLWRQNRAAQQDLRTLSAQVETAQKDLDRMNRFFALVTSPGAKVTELSGTSEASGAMAKLAFDRAGHAMLIARGLPRVPQGKEYQLWFIVSGKSPVPGKTFAPDDTGNAMSMDQIPATALNADVFAITLEPAGGVSAPTSAIYLRSGL